MALLDFTRAPSRSVPGVDRIVSFVTDQIASFIAWNDMRRTRDALSQLSDHELHDIGLHRGDLDAFGPNTY